MKLLAIFRLNEGVTRASIADLFAAEEQHAWQKYVAGKLEQMYLPADFPGAIFVLNYPDLEAARSDMKDLPMMQAGVMTLELTQLMPFLPLEILLKPEHQTGSWEKVLSAT